jgi:hypothetical protein
LAPISVSIEKPVNRFYPLRYPDCIEGVQIVADIVALFEENSQQASLIADVSSVIARSFNASNDFQAPARARSRAKLLKYDKYDIPRHLFHPITVGRTNVLSADALNFCDVMGKFFPSIPMVVDKIKAAISRAIVVGAARTLNTAFRRAQLAAFNAVRMAQIPKSAACRLLQPAASLSASMFPSFPGLIDAVIRTPVPRLIPPVNSAPSTADDAAVTQSIGDFLMSDDSSLEFTLNGSAAAVGASGR